MVWTRWLGALGLALALGVSGAALTGCEQDAGDHFEDAVEDAGDAAQSAGEGIKQGAEDAQEAVEDQFDD